MTPAEREAVVRAMTHARAAQTSIALAVGVPVASVRETQQRLGLTPSRQPLSGWAPAFTPPCPGLRHLAHMRRPEGAEPVALLGPVVGLRLPLSPIESTPEPPQ